MSETRAMVAALGIALLAVMVPRAHAAPRHDGPRDTTLARIARLDSLLALRHARFDSLADAARRGTTKTDVREGMFQVRTTPALAERVREAERLATAMVAPRGGDVLRALLTRRMIMITTDSVRRGLGAYTTVSITTDTSRRTIRTMWNGEGFSAYRPVRATDLADRLASIAEQVAMKDADSVLAGWVMIGRLPLRDAPRDRWTDAYTELATVESAALRRCRARSAEACLSALGLASDPRAMPDEWYEPSDYRALVASVLPPRSDSAAIASALRCRETPDAAACARAVRAIPRGEMPPPLSPATRALFLEEVLRAGGPGAYERLMAARGPMRERLAAAAGSSLDRVADAWLARVAAARPEPMRVPASMPIVTLAWCGAFLSLAVVRRRSCQ